jgi:hypothetical protein
MVMMMMSLIACDLVRPSERVIASAWILSQHVRRSTWNQPDIDSLHDTRAGAVIRHGHQLSRATLLPPAYCPRRTDGRADVGREREKKHNRQRTYWRCVPIGDAWAGSRPDISVDDQSKGTEHQPQIDWRKVSDVSVLIARYASCDPRGRDVT